MTSGEQSMRIDDVPASTVTKPCKPGNVTGPFPFMKGPIYVLSASLARRVVHEMRTLYRSAIRGRDGYVSGSRNEGTQLGQVWEDVWMGYALSQLDPPPKLDVVSIRHEMLQFQEGLPEYVPDFGLAKQAIVWHANPFGGKNPTRIPLIHRYMRTHHCSLASEVVCELVGRSCTGGVWRLCLQNSTVSGASGCTGGATRNYLEELRTEQSDNELPAPLSPGYCNTTSLGEGVLCGPDDVQGTWLMPSASECLAACRKCAQCHFVSYSARDADCSWFRACARVHGARRGGTGHATWRVREG